jgi:hypothetical protein
LNNFCVSCGYKGVLSSELFLSQKMKHLSVLSLALASVYAVPQQTKQATTPSNAPTNGNTDQPEKSSNQLFGYGPVWNDWNGMGLNQWNRYGFNNWNNWNGYFW